MGLPSTCGRDACASGVAARMSSSVLNGSENIGRDLIVTTAKLIAAARSWSTGSESNSNMRFASSWNHAVSALRALTGSRQMDATAILDYFAPLKQWLDEQTKGQPIGW